MSDGWHPISDDGERLISTYPNTYSLYDADGKADAENRQRFRYRGSVISFEDADLWLRTGALSGPVMTIEVAPKLVKVKSGTA